MSNDNNTVYKIVSRELLGVYLDNCRRDPARRIFSVLFTKKNGELRRMAIKPGRRSKGGKRAWNPEKRDSRFVFDTRKREWRAVNLLTLHEVSVCGIRYVTMDRWLQLNWGSKRIPFGGDQ